MAVVYLKLVVGMVITRTLLALMARGSIAGATTAIVPVPARSISASVTVVTATATVSAPFFLRLERKRLAL